MGTLAVTPGGLQTAALVRQYFPSSAWATMIAIADAESTFDCAAQNGPYIGLFQIGPNWYTNPATMLNCITNTQTAVTVLQQQGLGAWQSYTRGTYKAFIPLAQELLAQTAPKAQVAAPVVLAPSFGVNGSANVSPGGRIVGTVNLHADRGSVPYRVVMSVSPGYGSSYPTSTTATGTVGANQTLAITQSLVAPLPSPEIIRAYQLQQSGPVTFRYTVQWTVTDTSTGQSHTVNGGSRLSLIVQ